MTLLCKIICHSLSMIQARAGIGNREGCGEILEIVRWSYYNDGHCGKR
jgi:hypothetical protein